MDQAVASDADYEADMYAWTQRQAALLKAGRFAEADIDNIIEEIETLGRSEKSELVNRLAVLLVHLLKWQFQPDRRSRSWTLSIKEQRIRLGHHLDDNPSLRSRLGETITDAYRLAVVMAQQETKLPESAFPATCPYTPAQILADDFLPE